MSNNNSTIENGICVTCDRPVIYDDGSNEPTPDDKCLRSKSYCTDRDAHIDWRERYKHSVRDRDGAVANAATLQDNWHHAENERFRADVLVTQLRAALVEACEIGELALHGGRLDAAKSYRARIAELRKLADGGS